MDPERWQRIERLFASALEIPSAERPAYLDGECGADAELREKVTALLAVHDDSDSFLRTLRLPKQQLSLSLLQPGRSRLGKYQVLGLLGSGGMGVVYRARDERLGRDVALKVLPAAASRDPERLRRFEQEARATGLLNHPNILTVFDVGEHEGAPYVVSELLEGETLRSRLGRGRPSVREAVDWAAQVAEGLAAAHEKGVVHRDLKPENLFLRSDGYVKILDFGLAKLTQPRSLEPGSDTDDRQSTAPGVVMGTVRYMSPEQARGLPLDARSDLFSLGVVLYELLAGVRPFEGETSTDIILAIVDREPPPLAPLRPDAPAALERVVMRLLEKAPERRYQTARELLGELRAIGRQMDSGAELSTVRTVPKWRAAMAGRRRALGWVVAAVVAATAGVVGYALLPGERVVPARSVAVLPFEHASGNQTTEHMTDGLTEGLISDLAKVSSLRTTSRTSAFRYKGRQIDPATVGRELGVEHLVVGIVDERPDHLEVAVEVIEAATGRQVWSDRFAERPGRWLEARRGVSQATAEHLGVELTEADRARLEKGPTADESAYELYLRGRTLFWSRRSVENLQEAIKCFDEAVRRDPSFALAYTGLADSYTMLGQRSQLPKEIIYPAAKTAALRAVSLDASLAEAHTSLGLVLSIHEWDAAGAEREHRRALEIEPNYVPALCAYALLLGENGRHKEAKGYIDRARELDPLAINVRVYSGWVACFAGRYDDALAFGRRALEIDPESMTARWILGTAQLHKGEYAAALAEMDRPEFWSDPHLGTDLGYALALAGRTDDARRYLERFRAMPRDRNYPFYGIALTLLVLGDRDGAFASLGEACANRADVARLRFKTDPALNPLRSDPRFAELLRCLSQEP